GDGLVDLVRAYSDANNNLQLDLLLSNPDGSGFAQPIHIAPAGLQYGGVLLPMDVNGDGCIDLVYALDNDRALGLTVLTAGLVDGQWTFVAGPVNGGFVGSLPWGGTLLSMDVDGDGKVDLVYVTDQEGTLGLEILFSDGTAFAHADQDQTLPTIASGG